jgi:gluconolactonase
MRRWIATALLACGGVCAAESRYSASREPAAGPGSPEIIVLRDAEAGVEAAIAPSEGGELSSLRVRYRGQWVELVYRARDYSKQPGFRGKASFLWPAVGAQYPVGTLPETSCGEGTYTVDGHTYPMPCHGFARNMAWREAAHSADQTGARVTVELSDSERTRKYYPFGFRVRAEYMLAGGQLEISYVVDGDKANTNPMIFSIGNHMAFRVPFLEGSDGADMLFETPSTIEWLRNSRGVLSGEGRPRSFAAPVRLGDFDAATAIPLGGYQGAPYAVLSDPQGLALRIRHTGIAAEPLVQFNAYGGPKRGYFSPEPWFGIQNSLNLHRGLVTVPPGGSWKWTIALSPQFTGGDGVEKVAGGFGFIEGPVWSHDGFLVFSDIERQKIMKLAADGSTTVYRDRSNAANGNATDAQGRLYTCERDGRRVARMTRDGSLSVVADRWEGKKLNSPNDVTVRKDGHVYFTDPASKAVQEPMEIGFNGVYHVRPDGKISLVSRTMSRPNGVALSPDGHILYVADSEKRAIVAFDLDEQGNALHERVLIAATDGSPDGLRVSAAGNLYIACRGIAVYSPDGKLLRTIAVPEQPANCGFGDADLRTLYITARTSLYKVRLSEPGALQY